MRMKKNGRSKWRRRLSEAFDFLPDTFGVATMQLIENEKLIAFECYTIDKYSEDSILLNTERHRILVLGKRLRAEEFENKRLEISGIICSVQFSTQKENYGGSV